LAAGSTESDTRLQLLLEWDGRTVPVVSYEEIERSCSELLAVESVTGALRAELLLRLADARYYLGDDEGSARAAEQLHRAQSDDVRGQWRLARAWLQLPASQAEGLALAERLVADQPDHVAAYHLLARYYLERRKLPQAIDYSTRAILRDERNQAHFLLRAHAHFLQRDLRQCLRDLDAALVLPTLAGTSRAELHKSYGSALLCDGRQDEAIPWLVSGLRFAPTEEQTMGKLWLCFAHKHEFGNCLTLSNAMIEKYPGNPKSHWMHARSLAQLGDADGAARFAERAVEMAPLDGLAWSSLGVVCAERGDMAAALSAFWRAGKMTPAGADAGIRVAFILATCGDDKTRNGPTALQGAQKCLELLHSAEQRRVALIVRGLAEAESGRTAEAVRSLACALESGREDPELRAACQKLKSLFEQGKAYRYDPRGEPPPPFRINPAMVFVNLGPQ
jgi:tetratricopeptide (TPR) repeat protein